MEKKDSMSKFTQVIYLGLFTQVIYLGLVAEMTGE